MKRFPDRTIHFLSFLGGAVFLVQLWLRAHTQTSVLDEGLYLYKGWLFANGTYVPFQDYGPWTNHMPLSYLIPGWFQVLFGPGLMTGRLLAILCGILVVFGLWLLARRFGGSWWGAGVVWAVALNPAVIKIFSVQASQVLAAAILVWALVLLLGEDRPAWQLALGMALAGALGLTRFNLIPILPLSAVYVYWTHGRKTGHIALAAGLFVFLLGHAVYWPEILKNWTPWFPDRLTPFLDAFRRPPNDGAYWAPEIKVSSRLFSLLQGIRFHFTSLMAVLVTILAFPLRSAFPTPVRYKTLVFLATTYLVLLVLHAWAALGNSYCVFCFTTYLSFFSLTGLLVLVIAYPYLNVARFSARYAWWFLFIVVCAAGLSTFNTLGEALIRQGTTASLLKTQIPRLSGGASYPIWGLIENLTGKNYEYQVVVLQRFLRYAAGTGLGALAMIAIGWMSRRFKSAGDTQVLRLVNVFFAASLLFSPTVFLGGGYHTYDCSGDVIAAYEEAGAYLDGLIPPGARVYWDTFSSPIPLLYMDDIVIYPQQLNGFYSYKYGGDPDALARFGHWNRALSEQWASEADVVLLSPAVYRDPDRAWLVELVESGEFKQFASTGPVHPCDPESRIVVFVRK